MNQVITYVDSNRTTKKKQVKIINFQKQKKFKSKNPLKILHIKLLKPKSKKNKKKLILLVNNVIKSMKKKDGMKNILKIVGLRVKNQVLK